MLLASDVTLRSYYFGGLCSIIIILTINSVSIEKFKINVYKSKMMQVNFFLHSKLKNQDITEFL